MNNLRRQMEEEYEKLSESAYEEYNQGSFKEEILLWQQGVDVAQKLNDIEKELHCYRSICQDSYHLGDYKNALLFSFKVTKCYSDAAPLDLYHTLTRQLHIAQELIIPRKCIERLLDQIEVCNNQYRLQSKAGDLLDKACLYIDCCAHEKALPKAQRSKILRMENGGGYNLPSHLRILFLCYYLDNNVEQMKKTIIELQNCETNAKTSKENCICFCRYILYYMQGDYVNAFVQAEQSLTLRRKRNVQCYQVLYHLVTIASACGMPQIARGYLIELMQNFRDNRKKDKRYWQRYYTYRGLGHYYASCSKSEESPQLASDYSHRSNVYYRRALAVAEQIDDLLCTDGWRQKVNDDLKSLESSEFPKPILCDR